MSAGDGTAVLVTGPTSEPVTLADLKNWARVSTTADDDLLAAVLTAARLHVEEITGRALITQTWDYFLDYFPYGGLYPLRYTYGSPYAAMVPRYSLAFPSGDLSIPRHPVQSVTYLKYVADDGTLTTLDPSFYQVDLNRIPARILPSYGNIWPVARAVPNAVNVRYVAGFGNTRDLVPAPLSQAIKVLAATMYEQREAHVEAALQAVPLVFDRLIDQYKVFWL